MDTQTILATDQTQTPESDILGENWYGDHHVSCSVYGGSPIMFQWQDKKGNWLDASFEGTLITLTRAGDVAIVTLAASTNYRVKTAVAGSEVEITIQNPADRVRVTV